jgi:hypothetical protein
LTTNKGYQSLANGWCVTLEVNLRSSNWENDALIIAVVLFIGCAYEFAGPNIFQITSQQQLVGGALCLVLHLCGTDLPIMIFIYSILLPRYSGYAFGN